MPKNAKFILSVFRASSINYEIKYFLFIGTELIRLLLHRKERFMLCYPDGFRENEFGLYIISFFQNVAVFISGCKEKNLLKICQTFSLFFAMKKRTE